MSSPRFSIVIACYNQRHFVQEAVESALSQAHPSTEIIAVDDASSDGTSEILEKYGNAIRLVKLAKNQGPLAARNHGSSLATGEYLVFLDGDDVLMPWTLQVYERLIAAHSPKIILGRRFYFEGEVPRETAKNVPEKIDYVNYSNWFQKDRMVAFGASNLVIHRATFWKVAGWSPGLFHLDVTDLLLKLGLSGNALVVLAPATVWYRRHSGSVTRDVRGMLECARDLLKKEKAGEYPGGRKYFFSRAVCLGGPILFWSRRAVKRGYLVDALKMATSAWLIIFAAIVQRFIAITRGQCPAQSLELNPVKTSNTQ